MTTFDLSCQFWEFIDYGLIHMKSLLTIIRVESEPVESNDIQSMDVDEIDGFPALQ